VQKAAALEQQILIAEPSGLTLQMKEWSDKLNERWLSVIVIHVNNM
jgi:hypothetical protein